MRTEVKGCTGVSVEHVLAWGGNYRGDDEGRAVREVIATSGEHPGFSQGEGPSINFLI